jgi:hypothetical protein
MWEFRRICSNRYPLCSAGLADLNANRKKWILSRGFLASYSSKSSEFCVTGEHARAACGALAVSPKTPIRATSDRGRG